MLSTKAFTKATLVFWKNIFIKIIVQLLIKTSFMYFWNRKTTDWSMVWFICSSIIFISWTNFSFLEVFYEISLSYTVINAFVNKPVKENTEFVLAYKVLFFKNWFFSLVLNMIALLTYFGTNLEWLAPRNLVFSGATLFQSSIKHFLRVLKSKLFISRLVSLTWAFSKNLVESEFF